MVQDKKGGGISGLRPILCWVGGKTKLRKELLKRVPEHKVYVEGFAGGATLFFAKEPAEKEVLNDKNKDLINFYRSVKNSPGNVARCELDVGKDKFLKAKDKSWKTACEMLLVNKRSYGCKGTTYIENNGQNPMRNGQGEKYKERLKDTTILSRDFKAVVEKYDSKDTFTYLDPPYWQHSNGIAAYAEGSKDLHPADVCQLAKDAKGKVLISYNDHPDVKKACRGLKIEKVKTKYEMQKSITGKAKPVTELLIRNY